MPFHGEKFNLKETGRLFEYETVGSVDIDNPEYKKALAQLPGIKEELAGKIKKENGRLDNKELARQWKDVLISRLLAGMPRAQPYDATHPFSKEQPARFYLGRDLRIQLGDLLVDGGMIAEDERDNIKFYTAVGTPLDEGYGTDAVLEFTDKSGVVRRVTIDVTTKPVERMKRGDEADIIVSGEDLPDPSESGYTGKIDEYAKRAFSLMFPGK